MSATNDAGLSRRQLLEMAGAAAAAAAVAGLARPAEAGQQKTMPLNANLTGPLTPRFIIPVAPPIGLGQFNSQGTSDLLGAVQLTEANTLHLGSDGQGIAVTDGISVLAGTGGDALFISYSGLVLNALDADFAFTILGGTGRFLGASGSGIDHCAIAADKKSFSRVIQGMVVLPASP